MVSRFAGQKTSPDWPMVFGLLVFQSDRHQPLGRDTAPNHLQQSAHTEIFLTAVVLLVSTGSLLGSSATTALADEVVRNDSYGAIRANNSGGRISASSWPAYGVSFAVSTRSFSLCGGEFEQHIVALCY
jgi:hypothetical protein